MTAEPDKSLSDLFAQAPIPQSPDEWWRLECQALEIFSPFAPIDDQALFAGRSDLLLRMVDTVFQKGRHAILYGERGVGKTSLANIIKDKIFSKTRTVKVHKRSCTINHDFRMMWVHALDDYVISDRQSAAFVGRAPNPYDIFRIIESIPLTVTPVFIFDEFDRIKDPTSFSLMADTIKYFADYGSRATIVIVGVADSVSELFGGHPSIQRNVQQLKMPRMSTDELYSIFQKRMPLLGMELDTKVADTIIELSQGLPTYTHLLGMNATVAAIRRRSMVIETRDFDTSIRQSIEAADETVKESYLKAVRSSKPNNNYAKALLACALAQCDEKGYFNAASVRAPYSRIMKSPQDIPDFNRHLNAFCKDDRGPALVQKGAPKSYEYRFAEPLVRPYALIRGILDKLIDA